MNKEEINRVVFYQQLSHECIESKCCHCETIIVSSKISFFLFFFI